MRTTPALALLGAFLASSVVSVLALPQDQAGLGQIPVVKPHHPHPRTCKLGHRHHGHKQRGGHTSPAVGPEPAPAPEQAPAADAATDSTPGAPPSPAGASVPATDAGTTPEPDASAAAPATDSAAAPMPWTPEAGSGASPAPDSGSSDKKMRKKKHKGKCALKHKPKSQSPTPQPQNPDQGADQSGQTSPITGAPGSPDQGDGNQGPPIEFPPGAGSQGGDTSATSGAPGSEESGHGGAYGFGDESGPAQGGPTFDQGAPGGNQGQDQGQPKGYGPPNGQAPHTSPDRDQGQGQGEGQGSEPSGPPQGYAPSPAPDNGNDGGNVPKVGLASGSDNGVHCKGQRGSTTLPRNGPFKQDWFDPSYIHHGPGTQFGGGDFWKGGACMFDSLPHANLPSVAMDQTFFQDGLACGTCVEIASTSASLFSNDAKWSVEQPRKGTLPEGKKTIAIVSDLCPGVEQCWSGLDMHPDTWSSVTNGADGSKLPINWKFVNCKEAFEKSGSGGSSLQIHWREGANPGFFEVQIRGSHEAVVRVEMKLQGKGWKEAKHVDNAWWKWEANDTNGCDDKTPVVFRVTDWQGQMITTEVGTVMNRDVFVQANFDRVESLYED